MFSKPGKMPPNLIPDGIYTIPEISMVGQTEEQLTRDKIAYETGSCPLCGIAKSQMLGDKQGLLKLPFDPNSLKAVWGAHDRGSGGRGAY